MVTIYNKSNRPIGVANQSVLPDKEIVVKDKFVYYDVCDENGVATGEKRLIPGLIALKNNGFVTIKEEPDEKPKKEKKPDVGEEAEKPKEKKTRKPKE